MWIIDEWIQKFKKYLFFYRDGFYEFPYLANSPELLLASLKGMPFIKIHPEKCYYETKTPILKGQCHYQELEEGLWIIMSDISVKKDMTFKLTYDNRYPKNYHFLTLYVNKGFQEIKFPKIDITIDYVDQSWTLFKAGSKAINTHFKGQNSIFFTIFLREDWLMRNLSSNGIINSKRLSEFFKSDQDCLFLPNFLEEKSFVYEPIIASLLNKGENGVEDILLLKAKTLELLSMFITKLDHDKYNPTYPMKDLQTTRRLHRVEHSIQQSILDGFPGIQKLASTAGVSETKFKMDFKKHYGVSPYQYFSIQQMRYAYEILKHNEVSVKELAFRIGYSSPSKFSAAFKKQYGFLPSEM